MGLPAVIHNPIISLLIGNIAWYASIPMCLELCTTTVPVPCLSAFSIAFSIAFGNTCKPRPLSPSMLAVTSVSLVIDIFGLGFISLVP